ncbi:conserved hypothetical protein [Bradyrhizobium sp. ORS 278]|uniref:hypothetical protein n=1 Tax=Bradyrhizobium sp. (strain ORS 278) TaxID=114615 RepID=UPI0001508AB8|nr:hypothetical protein [Bradyrhizobium sp. ORS 278]CAL78597.1 conserved hypothetical protein [Bradyrhizobium sp. ORS 278]
MADLKSERLGEGEALLTRLRRLKLRTAAAGKDDRAELLALMDDIETIRRKLLRECAQLEEELRIAAVRVTALNTYARVAQASRRPQREH